MNSTWSALAEPNRLRIVELLRQGSLSVGEVADRLGFNHTIRILSQELQRKEVNNGLKQ